jgi:5-methylcytosine-specific restriction endonuclease McrA
MADGEQELQRHETVRRPRYKNDKYLKFVKTLPCCVCGSDQGCDSAHIRFSAAHSAKVNPGVGQKPSDFWVVPLCRRCHDQQHKMGDEPHFWSHHAMDPLQIAAFLYLTWLECANEMDAEMAARKMFEEQR